MAKVVVNLTRSFVYKLRPTLLNVEFNEDSKNIGRNFSNIKLFNSHHFGHGVDDMSIKSAVLPWPKW